MPHKTLTLQAFRRVSASIRTQADWLGSRRGAADVAVFHDFRPPPYGGGNQFLLALVGELERRGLRVESNRLSGGTPACLYNSFNFDFARLRRFAREGVRMVHRVDGPIAVYRGFDDGSDARIMQINDELADVTVFQSQWSREKHRELGIELTNPRVIPNAVDPEIFHPAPTPEPLGARLRIVATSWSDNPRKGAEVLRWLDGNHDPARIQLTFVGNSQASFERIRQRQAVASRELADILRAHDVYLAASRDDPSSNALLEGLACGLPAAFRRSGGHPELVGDAGLGFDEPEELPELFEQLREELGERRAAIRVRPLAEVADRYLEALGG